ncbi:MAG: matrixin family metalloprotease [Acidobacteriota bacterium]|nr:matrixin family metalloprotease [Acidobacteriota bacterium]
MHRTTLVTSRRLFAVALICAVGFATGVAANYLGSGTHPSSTLGWAYSGYTSGGGGSYTTPAVNAMSTWSNQTDLYLYYTTSSWDVVFITDFFSGGWAGLAVCYNNSGQSWLSNPAVFNQSLAYCYAYNDRNDMDGASQSRRQNLFTHEAGHCFSLAHRSSTSSIMYPYVQSKTTLDTQDRNNINARY